ncbi:MAG TPA: hypothetical protein GX745_08160 [Clostridiales bacterium]|nr:hypothetical protein [Clostridiales bacterium]
MLLNEYVDDIKLALTGDLLDLEIEDATIARLVNKAFREVQKYIDIPKLVTVPFAPCIDLEGFKSNSITNVYRADSLMGNVEDNDRLSNDPMYMQQWMIYSTGGSMYNLDNYIMNFLSYNTLMQIRNTISTDLSFREDKLDKKLYISSAYDVPKAITIEFIPVYDSVETVEDFYWIDIIQRMALAHTKIALGRIRSHVTQSNALWTLDGETLLNEGNEELKELRERLLDNMVFMLPVD